jgi:S1-C subfamily serine protease
MLLGAPASVQAQTAADSAKSAVKRPSSTVNFLREKVRSNDANEIVVTFRNQEPFALTPGARVEYTLLTQGSVVISVETRVPANGLSKAQSYFNEFTLYAKHGEVYDLLLKDFNFKKISRSQGLKLAPELTAFVAEESAERTINSAPPPVFSDEDGIPFSTLHFIRSNRYIGSACRTDLTLPNQRDVPLSVGSIVHYKIYSEGEINITLDVRCPGVGYSPPSSRATQLSVNTKDGEEHYILYDLTSFSEISFEEARPYLDKTRNVMKQEEMIAMPINRGSFKNKKRSSQGQGTCFLISSGGYLITNYHCIEDSKEFSVKGINGDFSTGYAAKVVASDPSNDLALLRLTDQTIALPAPPYQLRPSGVLQAERIYALGFPVAEAMGNELKITEGIISARSGIQGDISKFQISAAVNPGNSGGPLIDESGNVVGVVYAKSGVADNAGYAVKALYLEAFLKNVDNFTYPTFTNNLQSLSLPQKVEILRKNIFILETK